MALRQKGPHSIGSLCREVCDESIRQDDAGHVVLPFLRLGLRLLRLRIVLAADEPAFDAHCPVVFEGDQCPCDRESFRGNEARKEPGG